jgi:uncharacterized protein (TIRG00374 family)
MNKKSALRFLQIIVTTALLIYVFHNAGLLTTQGWKKLFYTFSKANIYWIIASLILVFVNDFASSIKWFCLARSAGLQVGLWRLFAYYLVGRFFNLVLPSSIGGDVIRVHELGRYTGKYAESAAVVFVERFSGLMMLVFLAAVAVGINYQLFDMPWLTVTLAIGVVVISFICWLILDSRPYNLVQKFFAKKSFLSGFLAKIGKLRTAILMYKKKPLAIWIAVLNSLIFYSLAVIGVWVSALAFDGSVSLTSMIVAVPIIMFIMNIPFSIGGIGLTEFAYSFTFGLFGINPYVSLSTIVLMRLRTFLAAGVGSFIYLFLNDGMSSPQELAKEIGQIGKSN